MNSASKPRRKSSQTEAWKLFAIDRIQYGRMQRIIRQSSLPHVPWQNHDLVLYHGTIEKYRASIVHGIDVTRGRVDLDFGRGFYTTTFERQALSWAWVKSQREPGSKPVVLRFQVARDILAQLESMWFIRGTKSANDFWSLVFHCRRSGGSHQRTGNIGWYDVVAGPAVNTPLRSLSVLPGYDQISFHTPIASQVLNSSSRAYASVDNSGRPVHLDWEDL
jgi:hypothetical protein